MGPRVLSTTRILDQNMNCHPDRSTAKWRACPSEVEGDLRIYRSVLEMILEEAA